MSRKPNGYWNILDNCKNEALKYNTKGEFKLNSGSAYNVANNNNWLDTICEHMLILGNRHKRCIYVYEFPDNHAYIGLTYNLEKRHNERLCNLKDTVTKHINKTGLKPIRKQLTEYIDVIDAQKLEGFYVKKYRESGFKILNKNKTGGLGGNILKWTFGKCKEEALKYKTKSRFSGGNSSAYESARNNGWLNDICSHMISPQKPKGFWTFDKCKEEALKYETRTSFYKNSCGVHSISLKNGWLDEICTHMIENNNRRRNYWTHEKCHDEALKYSTKKEFIKNAKGAYNSAQRNKWLEIICNHMIK